MKKRGEFFFAGIGIYTKVTLWDLGCLFLAFGCEFSGEP